jgi:hypothetical protein
MTKCNRMLIITGVVLIGVAFISAQGIPKAAHDDFDKLVKSAGGRMSHTAGFPDNYKKMSAQRRMLQNFYVGAAGLICLAAGLKRQNTIAEQAPGE